MKLIPAMTPWMTPCTTRLSASGFSAIPRTWMPARATVAAPAPLYHPAIVLNPAWYKRVSRAYDELFEVYQDIGDADPPGSVLRFPQRK
jgi:hypothetical protein